MKCCIFKKLYQGNLTKLFYATKIIINYYLIPKADKQEAVIMW